MPLVKQLQAVLFLGQDVAWAKSHFAQDSSSFACYYVRYLSFNRA